MKKCFSFLSHRYLPKYGRRAKSGQVLIESIAGIIIFAIMLALIMTISMWLYVQQALVTSAREGARQACLNASMASSTAATKQSGINAVKAYIQDEVLKLTGQTMPSGNITITGPTGSTIGQRTMQVNLLLTMKNPLGIAAMLRDLGGNGSAFDSIPLSASATLRYEE